MPIEICIYENEIPAFVGPELERLYESVFSSLPFWRVYDSARGPVHTYVARQQGQVRALFLFEVAGNTVRVLNETIALPAAEMERFSLTVMQRYADVAVVSFNAIRPEGEVPHLPLQRSTCSEDIVVSLPGNGDAYLAQLGRSTRKNIKRYTSKLDRDHPGWTHEIQEGAAIQESDLRTIIALNRVRMQVKGRTPAYDEEAAVQMLQLVRSCGMLSLVRVDGKLVAGEICTRVGGHMYSHVGAHDPAFDEYKLGMLSCYFAICAAIARGTREFHLLWGQYAYKYSLAGVQRDLESVLLYRSRAHVALNGLTALRFAWNARMRQWQRQLQQRKERDDRIGAVLRKLQRLRQGGLRANDEKAARFPRAASMAESTD